MKKKVVRTLKLGAKKKKTTIGSSMGRELPPMQQQVQNTHQNWFGWGNTTGGTGPAPKPARDYIPAVDPKKRKFGQALADPPWTNPLFTQAFPSCCGMQVITNFSNTGKAADIKKGIKEHDKNAHCGMHLIVLNPGQIKAFEPTVLECGYEIIKNFRNPNHGHNITLYGKVLS
jgi:hypothetical protein